MRPPSEGRRLCYAPQRCLPWHLGTGFVTRCIGLARSHLYRCTQAWTHGGHPWAWAKASGEERLGGGLGRAGRWCLRVLLGPSRLRADPREAHSAPSTPRTGELARRATEVGDHLAAAATGHTLPRLMGRRCLTLALVAVACHEPIRLAFPA